MVFSYSRDIDQSLYRFLISFLALVCSLFYNLFDFIEVTFFTQDVNLKEFYDGKTVFITGATSGIGRSLVLKLSQRCKTANIILGGRNTKALESVTKQCEKEGLKGYALPVTIDLDDETSILKAVKRVHSMGLCIDILINCAGISSRSSAVDTTMETLNSIMRTNFTGAVLLTNLFLPSMLERNSGNIAIISSVQGKLGLPYRTAYSASKHAVQGYFSSLRSELLADDITVTIISPGYVKTNLSLNALKGDGSSYGKMDKNTFEGMKPEVCALESLKAIARGDADVDLCDMKSWVACKFSRVMPKIFEKLMISRAAKQKDEFDKND